MVLDPGCGSGTTTVAAPKAGRRFIVIDQETAAVDATFHRLLAFQESGEYRRTAKADNTPPAITFVDFTGHDGPIHGTGTWNNGDSYVVQGDACR